MEKNRISFIAKRHQAWSIKNIVHNFSTASHTRTTSQSPRRGRAKRQKKVHEKNVEKAAEFRSSDLNIGGLLAISVPFSLRKEWAGWAKAKFKLDINWRRKKGDPCTEENSFFVQFRSFASGERRKKMFDNQKYGWRMRNGKGAESRSWTLGEGGGARPLSLI